MKGVWEAAAGLVEFCVADIVEVVCDAVRVVSDWELDDMVEFDDPVLGDGLNDDEVVGNPRLVETVEIMDDEIRGTELVNDWLEDNELVEYITLEVVLLKSGVFNPTDVLDLR